VRYGKEALVFTKYFSKGAQMNKRSIEPLKIPVIGDERAALARREKSSGFFLLRGAKASWRKKVSLKKATLRN
jgi:hypothetical protein